MGKDSKIEWTDHTFNPWIGCTKISPGCAHCYAAQQDAFRHWTPEGWGPGKARRRTSVANWRKPIEWNAAVASAIADQRDRIPMELGDPANFIPRPRVFCASLADWLDDDGIPKQWVADLLDLIRTTPNLDWLLLTKRPKNFLDRVGNWPDEIKASSELQGWVYDWFHGSPPVNVWIGTTVEDQQRAKERIPELVEIPARVRFLSCEPMVGPVDLAPFTLMQPGVGYRMPGINWVICGGESGPGARPMNPRWARKLRHQCALSGVAFFFKQWGEWLPDNQRQFTTSGDITWGLSHEAGGFRLVLDHGKRDWKQDTSWLDGEEGTTKVGKSRAGRLLDGVEHSAFPEVRR